MTSFKLFFTRIFRIDPQLKDVEEKTDRLLVATLNGDSDWMLSCSPKLDHIECDDGNIYKKENE